MSFRNSGRRSGSGRTVKRIVLRAVLALILAGVTLCFFRGVKPVKAETDQSKSAGSASEREEAASAEAEVEDLACPEDLHGPRLSLEDMPAPRVPIRFRSDSPFEVEVKSVTLRLSGEK